MICRKSEGMGRTQSNIQLQGGMIMKRSIKDTFIVTALLLFVVAFTAIHCSSRISFSIFMVFRKYCL